MSTSHHKAIRGTREWAVAEISCCKGCSHGCRYCYARYDAVVKKAEMSAEMWLEPRIDQQSLTQTYSEYHGQVMFPVKHDIVPEILDHCLLTVEKLLAAGNNVLVVTKPHLDCIEALCHRFAEQKEKILFRFTITAMDDRILKFWEPGAPGFEERLASLKMAYDLSFATSVSIEPMLDVSNTVTLVENLSPWVNHSIWLGKMNKIDKRVECDSHEMRAELSRISKEQCDEKIVELYSKLKHNPLIRWKESIKEVVGLPFADRPGQDI